MSPHRACAALALSIAALLGFSAQAGEPRSACSARPAASATLAELRTAIAHGRFVAYTPTSLAAIDGRITPADEPGIRSDLEVLRSRFDGLITYGASHGAEAIPAIAAALNYRAVIIGIWDPDDAAEVAAATAAARRFPHLVLGLSLGNERLFARHTDPARLASRVARLRAELPGTPLSTSEPFHVFDEPAAAALLAELDFLLLNVHPVFQPWFAHASDETAARFVVNVVEQFAARVCGPVLVKETGVPTAPANKGFTVARQASFYAELRRLLPSSGDRGFAYFAAFDAPWRAYDATGVPGAAPAVHEEEAHWGLYDSGRHPKPAALALTRLPAH